MRLTQLKSAPSAQNKVENHTAAQRIAQRKENPFAGDPTKYGKAEPYKNRKGIPDPLKQNIEALSGIDLSEVRVHYNSDKPAKLQAHAYAQGSDIHLASGQEKHLPHEAWHLVQQKQGRVQPTTQMNGTNINDSPSLEKEADVMGDKAASLPRFDIPGVRSVPALQRKSITGEPVQCVRKKAAEAGISEEKFNKALRSTVFLYATLDGKPVGKLGGIFYTNGGLHAEENLIQYLIGSGVQGGDLQVYLTTSPCSSTFGTRGDGKTGCQEHLEGLKSKGFSVTVHTDHLYQPKDVGVMERGEGFPTGFSSYVSALTSDFDMFVGKTSKAIGGLGGLQPSNQQVMQL